MDNWKKVCVTKELVKKIYNDLSEEIKKEEYNNTYAWFDWNPIILNNNIEQTIHFIQEHSSIIHKEVLYSLEEDTIKSEYKKGSKYIITFYENYDERFFKLDVVKRVMKGIIDFEKIETLENKDGEIHDISLEELLNKGIILNKDKFLKIYFKAHKICLLKDLDLKNIDIYNLINIYDDLVNGYNSFDEIKYLDNIECDDIVSKYL